MAVYVALFLYVCFLRGRDVKRCLRVWAVFWGFGAGACF